jgi:ribulose-5-phosphate 4-epimerase/fuculose-1-phosphate aldolase
MSISRQNTEAHLREEVCRAGRSLFERGYVHGTTGNISVKLPGDEGGFLITPTDACLGFLEPEKLALVDAQGEQRSGERASKTLTLHRRIYQHAPEASCVIHTHSSWLVDLTLRGVWREQDIVPPLTPYFVMKVGHVPLVPYFRPGDVRVAEHVAQLIDTHRQRGLILRAVMCDRLGPQVWGSSTTATMAVLEELEETARLWLRSLNSGHPVAPLSEDAIEELCQHFKASW